MATKKGVGAPEKKLKKDVTKRFRVTADVNNQIKLHAKQLNIPYSRLILNALAIAYKIK